MVKRFATAILAVVLLSAAGWYGWQLGPWADSSDKYGVPIDFANLELGLQRLERAAHTRDIIIDDLISEAVSDRVVQLREAA